MATPRLTLIFTFAFLLDAVAGAAGFAVFRWIADQDPAAESVQLGLVVVCGSLVYLITCRLIPWLGSRLHGHRIVILGLIIGPITLVLLAVNRSVWAMYLLWPGMMASWGLIFPSVTGWIRLGRTGQALRSVLFFYCIAWMSGMTIGTFVGAWVYDLFPADSGASWVYLGSVAAYFLCLMVLAVLPAKSTKPKEEQAHPQLRSEDHVKPELARTFLRAGWIGNMLLMLCVIGLTQLFKKATTDLSIDPFKDGLLVVGFRIVAIAAAGLMMFSKSWHYRRWNLILSASVGVLGLCIVGLTSNYWVFMLGFALAGMLMGHNYYAGVYYSLSSVSSSDAVGQQGRAAVNESFFSIGAIFGAGLGGVAGWYYVRLPYFLFAGILILGLCWQLAILRKGRAQIDSAAQC